MKRKLIIVIAILLAFFVISSIAAVIIALGDLKTGNVASIKIHGPIFISDSRALGGESSSPDDIVEFIKEADKKKSIKAIILDINSPGGSAVASEEISQAISNANKTTVAVIREIGTSGAFWAATAADVVFASQSSITGSVGVIASYIEFSGLMRDYNVSYERLVAGERKDAGSPFRPLRADEREKFQDQLNRLHDVFISQVAKNRGLSEEKVRDVADGMFFLGADAKEWGLIDEIGTIADAIAYVEKKEDIKAEIVEYKKKVGLFELLSGVSKDAAYSVGKGIGSVFPQAPVIR